MQIDARRDQNIAVWFLLQGRCLVAMRTEQEKNDQAGGLAKQRRYLGPVVTAALLFLGTLVWAVNERSNTQRRELDQLNRYTESLAKALAIVVDRAEWGGNARDDEIRRMLADRVRLRWPFVFVAIVRGREVVAGQGAIDALNLRPGTHGDGMFVVRLPLHGRPPVSEGQPPPPVDHASRPRNALPWTWQPGDADGVQRDAAPLDLVAGFDPSVNSRALREAVIRVIATLVVAWIAIAALTRAWVRDVRGRDLRAALDNERRERSRLAEMSLAAAGLAHETKNPLGLILGWAQRLNADASTPPETKQVAEQIMDAADHAAARLSDFINFARIPTPQMQDVAAPEVLSRVVATMKPDFHEAGVGLELIADELQIRCDSGMLEQVLVNLLLNSLQASTAGTTTSVRLSRQGSRATLSVADQGRGIPPQLLPDVFKPYVTGRPGGHGLGLAIVRRIVEQHGWSISVHSNPGQGTTFTLTGLSASKKEEQA